MLSSACRIVLAVLVLLLSGVTAGALTVSGIALMPPAEGSGKGAAKLVIAADAEPRFGTLGLLSPDRLVIDLPGATFDMPPRDFAPVGHVKALRFGLIAKGQARIVLDLAAPVKAGPVERLATGDGDTPLFAIPLVPTDAAAFVAATAPAADPDPNSTPTGALPFRAPMPESDAGLPLVMIDPGHGGVDTGAMGRDGKAEKEVVLAFAKTLADELNASKTLRARLTRTDDLFIALDERVAIARRAGAVLLVSVHADTVRQKWVRGATVYTVSEKASDEIAAGLAEQENRSDVLAGLALAEQPVEVADILIDLARRETRSLSVRVAKAVVKETKATLRFNKVPWREANFRVLRSPDIPSILVELGYMSNTQDEKLLLSAKWRAKTAKTIAGAVMRLVATLPPPPVQAAPGNASVSP